MANFVTISYLKDNSLINGNVETARLTTILTRAQEMYIRPLLGRTFYDYLTALNPATGDDATLIEDYIRPMLIVACEIMSAKHFNWEIRNKSVGTSSDQYATPSTWEDNDKLVNDYRKQLQMYKIELVDFLNNNEDNYLLWKEFCGMKERGNSFNDNIGFAKRIRW